MDLAIAKMGCGHHCLQCHLDGVLRIRKKCRNACQCFVRFRVKDMQDCSDQKRMAGFLPMVSSLERSLRINEHVSDILDIANLPFAAPDFQQGIVGG